MGGDLSSITNEVLAEKIDSLTGRVAEIYSMTQKFSTTFVSHEVFELRLQQIDASQKSNAIEIEKLKSRRLVPVVVISGLASIVTGLFSYLLFSYLSK